MAAVSKIDSNVTGLSYAEELTPGVLPGSPVWTPLEPNSYSDFGGELTTIARNPINPSRQRKKGVVTDLDATGGFNTDLTQTNLQDLLQGYFFSTLRPKGEEAPTNVDGIAEEYDVAATAGFLVGSIVNATGFVSASNNGLKNVTAVTLDTSVGVAEDLADDASPAGNLVVVGHLAAADDLAIVTAGNHVTMTSSVLDFTTLGLIEGEWIFVGGDATANQFVNAVNNGFKRIRSIAANAIVFDKSDTTMVDETLSGGEQIQLWFGRVLKNELGALITQRTYQLERTLGAPDNALPAEIQSEYIVGCVPGEATFNIPTADKLNLDLSFIAQDSEQRTGAQGVKTGSRPALEEADAFNTSSDFSRIKLSSVSPTDENPTSLFAFVTDLSININNNLTPNKAVGFLGSFSISAGTFAVGGNITAYFADVAAVTAVRNNSDISLDIAVVKANAGWCLDLPLLTLGDGRPNVEQDQPITLPLNMDAATAAKIDPNLDYTALMVFWDYLPTLADT